MAPAWGVRCRCTQRLLTIGLECKAHKSTRQAISTKFVQHFIITRFNLRWSTDAAGDSQIDPLLLARRLELFERFCLPTVRGQTRQDFKWLVLFDSQSPGPVKARIEAYARWPNFVPVYLPPGMEHVGRHVVRPYLDGSPQTVITTRLDNDDGLCRTYVENIRRHENVARRTVLQFPSGYVWHRERIYLDRQECNAFTTLVEPLEAGVNSEFFTIYKGSHSDLYRLGPVVDVSGEPGWLQVIHGANVENAVRGVRCPIQDLGKRFDVIVRPSASDEHVFNFNVDRARTWALSKGKHLLHSIKVHTRGRSPG